MTDAQKQKVREEIWKTFPKLKYSSIAGYDVGLVADYLIKKLEDQERELVYQLTRKISFQYPLTFAKDMGTHAVACRGVRESDHVRMATDQETAIISFVDEAINSLKQDENNK